MSSPAPQCPIVSAIEAQAAALTKLAGEAGILLPVEARKGGIHEAPDPYGQPGFRFINPNEMDFQQAERAADLAALLNHAPILLKTALAFVTLSKRLLDVAADCARLTADNAALKTRIAALHSSEPRPDLRS